MSVNSRIAITLKVISFVSTAILIFPTEAAEKSIPDLSGQWGRDMIYLEQPRSGPGPIVNSNRKADGTMDVLGAQVGDYTNPILMPEAAEAVRRHGEASRRGHVPPDMHNMCWPEPPPFGLGIQFGVELIQQKDEVLLFSIADHKVRHVPLNVPHPVKLTPTWLGHSVGRYEGDTLVIDTVGIKAGPLSILDWYGTPHSEALHVIERYRLIDGEAAKQAQERHLRTYINPDGDTSQLAFEAISPFYGRGPIDPDTKRPGLQVEVTVEDPNVFTTAWSGLVTYRPVNGEWQETACAENHSLWGNDSLIPTANKADF